MSKLVTQQSLLVKRQDYRPCLKCDRHPRYPSIPAVTLHEGDVCLNCKSKAGI